MRIIAIIMVVVLVGDAWAEEPDVAAVPWGIAGSASSYSISGSWFPKAGKEMGVPWVRFFPEWRSLEPSKGNFKWDAADKVLKSAAEHKLKVNAILMGSTPWTKDKIHAFPMNNLADWSDWVTACVERYKDQVQHWEVWNEGNAGFNDGKHTTTDYANLAIATYTAAKKADPKAQVALSVASYDPAYINQVLIAMKQAGKPNCFDYICVHPYEVAGGLEDAYGEIPFLSMGKTLRAILKEHAPEKANAELWISEIGHRIVKRPGENMEYKVGDNLVKMYTMALAQGFKRVQWFEGQDPPREEDGFGLLRRDGSPRPSYHAMKSLTALLGARPQYIGWLDLSAGLPGPGLGFGFVFRGANDKPVMVAWATPESVWWNPTNYIGARVYSSDLKVHNIYGGESTVLKAGEVLHLEKPQIISGLSEAVVAEARTNAAKDFPWGGDFSKAQKVYWEVEPATLKYQGVYLSSNHSIPTVRQADGVRGIFLSGNQAAGFHVNPTFADFQTKEYFVRLKVWRLAPGNAGMNLNYEVADSKGQAAYKNAGMWFGLSNSQEEQTYTWHVKDACFAKMWGYDFVFRPENSVPFQIVRVEVSKESFDKPLEKAKVD